MHDDTSDVHRVDTTRLARASQLGLKPLADELSHLDPYAHTLETLRSIMLGLIQPYVKR